MNIYLTLGHQVSFQHETIVNFQEEEGLVHEIQRIPIEEQEVDLIWEQNRVTFIKEMGKEEAVETQEWVMLLMAQGQCDLDMVLGQFKKTIRHTRVVQSEGSIGVLVKFTSKKEAECFYDHNYYNSSYYQVYVKEVVLYLSSQEALFHRYMSQMSEQSLYQLPSCFHCLERIESHVTGVLFNQEQQQFIYQECQALVHHQVTCSTCHEEGDLWVCLICYSSNCGRYQNKHAVEHYENTQHLLSVQVQSGQIWNYQEDAFVDRLLGGEAPPMDKGTQLYMEEQVVNEYSYMLEEIVHRQRNELEREIIELQAQQHSEYKDMEEQIRYQLTLIDQNELNIKTLKDTIGEKAKKNRQLFTKTQEAQDKIEQLCLFNKQLKEGHHHKDTTQLDLLNKKIESKKKQLREYQDKLTALYSAL